MACKCSFWKFIDSVFRVFIDLGSLLYVVVEVEQLLICMTNAQLCRGPNTRYMLQVWASLLLYQQILDEIEANDYNNFTKKANVGKPKKILALPMAYAKALVPPSSRTSSLVKA